MITEFIKDMWVLVLILVFLFGFLFFAFCFPIVGSSEGEHVGYITAVEKNGLIFKTWRAYLKTDNQSSQEDAYCITDTSLLPELRTAAENKTHVKIEYSNPTLVSIRTCGSEESIIRSVKVLN